MIVIEPGKRKVSKVLNVHVELGFDIQSSTLSFSVAQSTDPFWAEGDEVRAYVGYGGAGGDTRLVFVGEIETIGERYTPRTIETTASAYSRRLQRPYGNPNVDPTGTDRTAFEYTNQTDTAIWNDLMRRAGVPRYDAGTGDEITYATNSEVPYRVTLGTQLGSVVGKLDQSSKNGQRTFDIAGTVIRRPILGVPSANTVWRYAEGTQGLTAPFLPIVEIARDETAKDIKNQAVVYGIDVSNTTDVNAVVVPVYAVRQAPNDLLGVDGDGNDVYEAFELRSDFLETRTQCDDVAVRYMTENNRVKDNITMKVALNPLIMPGHSLGITSAKMGIPNQRPMWVRHISHEVGDSGGWTNLQLEGGVGPAGYLIGLPPVAQFDTETTRETWVEGIYDAATTYYTVTADGNTSYDPDGFIVSWEWEASNGASGTGAIWQTLFTQEQWDDTENPPTITLTVTDGDTDATGPHSDTSAPQSPNPPADDFISQGIYVAADGRADATADGGATWGTWEPDLGASVISVSRLCPGFAYYGLDDGRLIYTADHLASSPTVAYAWVGHQITAIYISEINTLKVVVGTNHGQIYMTQDGFATAPTLMRAFPATPIHWVVGSIETETQWRVAAGSYVWITYDDFVTIGTLSTQDHTIECIELSPFGNYNAENVDANVKVETIGHSITFPTLDPTPNTARLAAFLRSDKLMAADDFGRAFVKDIGSAVFTQITSIGGGAVYALIADRLNQQAFYAGAADGLYKTYDAGLTWKVMRRYTDAGLDGLQIGLDSEPVAPREIARIVEFTSSPRMSIPGTGTVPIPNNVFLPGGVYERTPAEAAGQGWPAYKIVEYSDASILPPEFNPYLAYGDYWLRTYDDTDWTAGMQQAQGGWSEEYVQRGFNLHGSNNSGIWQLWRHKMSVPAVTAPQAYQKAIITVMHRGLKDLWFNDTPILGTLAGAFASHVTDYSSPRLITGGASTFEGTSVDVQVIDVTSLVVPGAVNLLAGLLFPAMRTSYIGTIWVAYRVMMNTRTELSVETDGPYDVYITTGEEARTYMLYDRAWVDSHHFGCPTCEALLPPPTGWTNPTYNDTSIAEWGPGLADRWGATIPHAVPDPNVLSLLNHSQWISSMRGTNRYYGGGSAMRQHWNIPAGEYTEALLSLRWRHAITVWFNGELVYQNPADAEGGLPPSTGYHPYGVYGETLDLDVLSILRPGQDNVLCIQVQRADIPGGGAAGLGDKYWGISDRIAACATLRIR